MMKQESTEDWLGRLTAPQRDAVTHREGPLLVLAGPGSGKTRVITHRVAHLIQEGVVPCHILAITFTNKASEEMRNRLYGMRIARGSTICTFHSLCARLLREFANRSKLSRNFSIYDDADQLATIRTVIKNLDLDTQNFTPSKILAIISNLKNDLVTPRDYVEQDHDFRGKNTAQIYQGYQKQLEINQALDFDDLLMKFALLLRDDPDLRNHLNERYQYVLVDEYQDTNNCQYQIARGLTLNHHNLCVTGDPDQSIYSWRGANIGNILAFEKDYPEALVVRLEENFRSTPQVLELADQLIQQNKLRKEKRLFTSNAGGSLPELVECEDEEAEAAALVQWVQDLRAQEWEYRQMAVFYRVNSMSRVLEEALIQAHVPYQIVRGVEFFKRREIKDMLAYLRLLANPADQVSLKRIINRPTRGIGNTTIQRLFIHSEKTGKEIWQVLQDVEQVPTLGAAAKTKVKKFVELIRGFQAHLEGPVQQIMQGVYEKSGLKKVLTHEEKDEAAENVDELINDAARYDAEAEEPSLVEYLQQVALYSDQDAFDESAGAVSLMTLHAAKGLEFRAVQIIGVEDGLIPHSRSLYENESLEEERRLLFVGMTRAEEKLRLSYARHRRTQGISLATIRSEFLRGLEGFEFQHFDGNGAESPFGDDPEDGHEAHEEEDFAPDYDSQVSPDFNRGEMVRHPKFGYGKIQQVNTSQTDCFVVVKFSSRSPITLDTKYAKLEKIQSGSGSRGQGIG
jgi:ATP-dependent DNA helicase UvrD/PcrA